MVSEAHYTHLQITLSYPLARWGYFCHGILLHAQQLLQLLHPLLPPLHLCKSLFQYFNLPINSHPFFFRPNLGKGPTSRAIFTLERQQLAMILCQRRSQRDGDKRDTKWFGTFVHLPFDIARNSRRAFCTQVNWTEKGKGTLCLEHSPSKIANLGRW